MTKIDFTCSFHYNEASGKLKIKIIYMKSIIFLLDCEDVDLNGKNDQLNLINIHRALH